MSWLAAVVALAVVQATPTLPSQAAFEHRLFVEAGFPAIAERTTGGRQVRRMLLHDPYMILPVPAAALERDADGRVTLTLQHRRWATPPVAVAASAWDELAALETAAFAPPVAAAPRIDRTAPPPPPPPICHGWIARFEADATRSASWAACGGIEDARLAYLRRFITIALATRPACEQADKDPFWAYQRCFAQGETMDDAAIGARYAALKSRWDALPASDRLSEARLALRQPQSAPGTPAWLVARDAVARFRDLQAERRDLLRQLRVLANDARGASPGDRARLSDLIDAWSFSLPAQDSNYVGLTDALIWPQPAPGVPAPPATRR